MLRGLEVTWLKYEISHDLAASKEELDGGLTKVNERLGSQKA